MPTTITIDSRDVLVEICLRLLDGQTRANAMMPWAKPGPIHVPDDPHGRRALVRAHISGSPSHVAYAPAHGSWQSIRVEQVVLFALCPGADALTRWFVVDLDAAHGHGSGGLVDPAHAAKCLAERVDSFGLVDGLVVASSRGGKGRHVWMIFDAPVSLADAVVGVGRLAAQAYLIAERDVHEYHCDHAFRCANGTIAHPGQSGAFELVPHSDEVPPLGWAMVMPAAGAFTACGGGILLDPFADKPIKLRHIPRCNPAAWASLVEQMKPPPASKSVKSGPCRQQVRDDDPLNRLDPRTRAFLDGQVVDGRNDALFAATCNMIGLGIETHDAENLAIAGASACRLPERETRSTIRSAMRTMGISL